MQYKLGIDLSGLFASQASVAEALYPLVSQAVRAVAEEGAFRWKQSVQHASLWEVEKQRYIESIQWKMVGPMEAEITTDYDQAGPIETGRPSRDLKKMLSTSQKTRRTKSGKRYLVIPFRHNSSGNTAHTRAMPSNVYNRAKKLAPSKLLPPGTIMPAQRLSASGHLVAQHSYDWGGRLPAGLVPKLKSSHKTDIYAGMYRFDTSTPKSKSSAYLTFRVMVEGSAGWIVPAKPGLYLAKKVSEELQPLLEDSVGQAVRLSL